MEDYLPFFVGSQPFLFKIKGGPKPPDLAVTNEDLTRLAEAYTRGPDGTQEATWRKYRHCKQLSDIMDVAAPKLQLISRPPYGMYNVEGSLKNWASLRKLTTSWKQTEGLGSLTQLREDALAEEKEDGQPYISDGSRDNEPEKEEHVEGSILVSDDSESEKEYRRRGRPQVERRENIEGPAPISDPEAESGDEYVLRRPLRGGPRRRPRESRTLANRGYHNAQRGGAPLNGHARSRLGRPGGF
ncbi:uncharacterized protein ARMOST_02814 [Armillaria ostoyae]|uniref:Uncharacterized protein n=1 Tax=Armillaria ostoyae TaxID=47428 RepID=A0A284QSQ7_ARMOS|nr:uncharacterized protein ARMOST_02814 [Armillaria ostoyae]